MRSERFLELQPTPNPKNTKKPTKKTTKTMAIAISALAIIYISYKASNGQTNTTKAHKWLFGKIDPMTRIIFTPWKLCNHKKKLLCKSPGYRMSKFDGSNIIRVCFMKENRCQADQTFWLTGSTYFLFEVGRFSKIKDDTKIPIEICYMREEDPEYNKEVGILDQKFKNCLQYTLDKKGLGKPGEEYNWHLYYIAREDDSYGTFVDDEFFNRWVEANSPRSGR